jgi:hypothetical protein
MNDPSNTRLKRPQNPMPDFIRSALEEQQLMTPYHQRPAYQQNDYIGWITRAKQSATRQKRMAQMLDELVRGDVYMKMPWRVKGTIANTLDRETSKINKEFAEKFAADWIDSWNSHNLERVLAHYTDDFEMNSPVIVQIAGEPSGTLKGKEAVGAYWAKALELIPDLRFELINTLVGVNSITLYYLGARGRLAAEVFHFGPEGKVAKAFAHYAP